MAAAAARLTPDRFQRAQDCYWQVFDLRLCVQKIVFAADSLDENKFSVVRVYRLVSWAAKVHGARQRTVHAHFVNPPQPRILTVHVTSS